MSAAPDELMIVSSMSCTAAVLFIVIILTTRI